MALVMTRPSAAKVAGVVGLNPPWKNPQLMFLALSRSPTLRPVIITLSRVVQSSKNGCGSLMTAPAMESAPNGVERSAGIAPPVWPAIRFSAPGDEGPNVVLEVVAHREVPRVVPQRRHRAAVVVAHDETATDAVVRAAPGPPTPTVSTKRSTLPPFIAACSSV